MSLIEDYLEADVFDALAFAPCSKAGDLLFISGVAPLRGNMSDLELVGLGDMAAQTSFVLKILKAILSKEDLDPSAIVNWTVYTTDMDQLMELAGAVLLPWLGDHRPSSTFVGCATLAHPQQMVEITATALLAK